MVTLLVFAALTVDIGYLYIVRCQLQNAADAAALAAAGQLINTDVRNRLIEDSRLIVDAQRFALLNHAENGKIVADPDFIPGHWDEANRRFDPAGVPINAVRVFARRAESNQNPVSLFLAPVIGIHESDVWATATAYMPTVAPQFGSRFLIDDEMFDTDVPAIEDLARANGVTSEDLLTDRDGDLFIDFPPGVIELPTGQVGDEALFEIGPDFPYTNSSDPSLQDFLQWEESGDWHGIDKSDMDPLEGVEPFNDESRYPEIVNPNLVHVSPIWKSDVSDTDPGVNALGERRGLVAFKIIGVGSDPDGDGSVLPNLIIEIIDPIDIFAVSEGGVLVEEGLLRPVLVE
jgi:hypothetical protein